MTTPDQQPTVRPSRPIDDFQVVVGDVDLTSGDVHVHVVGELDALTAPALRAALDALCGSGDNPAEVPDGATVVLDLSRLSFMDTAGLRALVESHIALASRGWRVCPSAAQPQIAVLLGVAGRANWLPEDFLCKGGLAPHAA